MVVPEPTIEETFEILQGLRERYEVRCFCFRVWRSIQDSKEWQFPWCKLTDVVSFVCSAQQGGRRPLAAGDQVMCECECLILLKHAACKIGL